MFYYLIKISTTSNILNNYRYSIAHIIQPPQARELNIFMFSTGSDNGFGKNTGTTTTQRAGVCGKIKFKIHEKGRAVSAHSLFCLGSTAFLDICTFFYTGSLFIEQNPVKK